MSAETSPGRVRDDRGFTLIELLVVILIIGILAAIALPAFLNQRSKAHDANAKESARTAQTAMETYYTDHQSYVGADVAALVKIEPALTGADLTLDAPTATDYTLHVTSKGAEHDVFTVQTAGGVVTRSCTTPGSAGCPASGSW